MPLADRSCPRSVAVLSTSMKASAPGCGPLCGRPMTLGFGVAVFLVSAALAHAQDAAEAARQERARKPTQQKSSRHVYTEDDLKHPKILIPEDQARVEARRKQNSVPAQQDAQSSPANEGLPKESLGEIARRYRREKAAPSRRKREISPRSPIDSRTVRWRLLKWERCLG
jgi:hypothetical protein